MLNNQGHPIGRLGSQAWSPKYQHQLITVMLEKPFFGMGDEPSLIEVQLDDGTHTQAQILRLPFDFKAAGIRSTNP